MARKFREFGIPFEEGIALTGLKGMLETGNAGPTVAVMGELDSLKVLEHPHADPVTAAAHACGHHCQIAMMLAVGIGLKAAGVPHLAGRVALLAVPAEEYIAYRDQLRREGKLEFLGGKPEFIRLGKLDDIDLAMMTHTPARPHMARSPTAVRTTVSSPNIFAFSARQRMPVGRRTPASTR